MFLRPRKIVELGVLCLYNIVKTHYAYSDSILVTGIFYLLARERLSPVSYADTLFATFLATQARSLKRSAWASNSFISTWMLQM